MEALDAVSVIIPTRDRAELTERAVRSVLEQTRPPSEILVVDDGSSDGTAEHLRDVFPGDGSADGDGPPVRIHRTPPRGVSAARNIGIRLARGAWLAFLDSDDTWTPDKLEAQAEALAASPGHELCHTDEIWIRNGRRVNPRQRHEKGGGRIFRRCLPLCAISPSSVLIHRRIFERVGLFDEDLPACEDYDLWLRITARYPVLYVDRPLTVKYGGHADQLSRTVEALDRYRIRALERILETAELAPDDHRAAIDMLLAKIEVYAPGARRRGRVDEAEALETLAERWRRLR